MSRGSGAGPTRAIRRIWLDGLEECDTLLAGMAYARWSAHLSLTCPNCGNSENFLVKTLQMHLLRVTDGQLQPPQEEGRPALVEVLCDECDSTVDLDALEEDTRRELHVTLGAR
jgi:hypothetical protein